MKHFYQELFVIALICLAMVLLCCFVNFATAEELQTTTVLAVSSDHVNLRSTPELLKDKSNIIKQLDITTVIFSINAEEKNDFYHVWAEGDEGYIHKDYAKWVTISIPQGYQVVSSCVTIFTDNSETSNRVTNIQLACQAISGKILMTWEQFSYNGTLGERTRAKGYREAPVISSGKMSTGIGGGICQVSSTLYKATLNAGLQIDDRTPHPLEVSYTRWRKDGYGTFDATVNWANIDFKFSNNLDYPITIFAGTDSVSNSKSACWVLICTKVQ